MKVYLLNAPFKDNFVRCGRWQGVASRGGTLYYPIWLSYATGVLEKAGHKVKLVDAPAWKWDRENVIKDAKKFNPDLIVVDSNFSSLKNDCEVAKILKDETGALSVLVGPPVSQFSEKILNSGVDVAARFEYDFTIREIAETIENDSHFDNTRGISFKNNGKIIHNPDREFLSSTDLDEIPFVSLIYKKHLNLNDYFLGHTLNPMVQIFTGRGCPNKCTFCSWPENLMGRKHRVRSVENVVNEFEFIINDIPEIHEIFIEDDTFTISKKRIQEVCSELKKRRLDVKWSCNSRANLDYESMKIMKEAGCRLLDVGYESGSDKILQGMKKGITTVDSIKFTKDAKKAGLMILADFIIGMPGETKDTVEQTVNFISSIKPNILQVSVATPMPGTDFYRYVKDNGYLLTEDMENSIDENGFQQCIISYPNFPKEEIEFCVDKVLKQYYLSTSFIPIALSNICRENGIHELKGMVKSAGTFLKYIQR